MKLMFQKELLYLPVLPDCLHAGLLADGVDVCAGDLVGPGDVVLEVDLVGEVHLGGDGREDEALLAAVGQGKLDLAVETA